MTTCLYLGNVYHERHWPRAHRFAYRIHWFYTDLDTWDQACKDRWLVGSHRGAPLRLRATDHLKCAASPPTSAAELAEGIRTLVGEVTGSLCTGPVRLLTQLRNWGHYFAPLTLYYCYSENGSLTAVVAEVNNTPWGEQHLYVLPAERMQREGATLTATCDKAFHVSPFMAMPYLYRWRLTEPGDDCEVRIDCSWREAQTAGEAPEADTVVLTAGMELSRLSLSTPVLLWSLLRFPFSSWRLLAAIYYQAFWLWMKRCRYFPHPLHN